MISQLFSAFQKDDKVLVLTATTNGSIAGDTYEFLLNNSAGTLQYRVSSSDRISITDAGSGSTPGIVQVDLTAKNDTLPAATYTWQFRRITAGHRDTLAVGTLPLTATASGAA